MIQKHLTTSDARARGIAASENPIPAKKRSVSGYTDVSGASISRSSRALTGLRVRKLIQMRLRLDFFSR